MGSHGNRNVTQTLDVPGDGAADASSRAIFDAIRRIVQALRTSSRRSERRLGLSAAQLFVLQRLAGAPAMSMNDLAARTLTHQSSVSVVVHKLAARGLVARRPSATDGRRVMVTLTPRGRAAMGRTAVLLPQDRLLAGLARLGVRRRSALARGLGDLVQAMSLSVEAPEMFFEAAPGRRRRRSARAERRDAR